MKKRKNVWLWTVLLLAAILAHVFYPAAVNELRRETARILADDIERLPLVEALGRAAGERDWKDALVAALSRQSDGSGA